MHELAINVSWRLESGEIKAKNEQRRRDELTE